MAKYKVIKEIITGSGYLIDKNGNSVSMQRLAPKVGDIINGTIVTQFIFNKNLTGLSYPITTGRTDGAGDSEIFIPSDSLQLVDDQTSVFAATPSPAPVPINSSTLVQTQVINQPKSSENTEPVGTSTSVVAKTQTNTSNKIFTTKNIFIGISLILAVYLGYKIIKH